MREPGKERMQEQLAARYDRYVSRVRELLESSKIKGREALESAMISARENLIAVGEISAEQGKVFGEYLKRDLAQTSKDMEQLGEEAWGRLHPARLGAGALAASAETFRLIGRGLLTLSGKANESLTYHAGDITGAGTLTCLQCGAKTEANEDFTHRGLRGMRRHHLQERLLILKSGAWHRQEAFNSCAISV